MLVRLLLLCRNGQRPGEYKCPPLRPIRGKCTLIYATGCILNGTPYILNYSTAVFHHRGTERTEFHGDYFEMEYTEYTGPAFFRADALFEQ